MEALGFIVATLAVLQIEQLGEWSKLISGGLVVVGIAVGVWKWVIPRRWFQRLIGPKLTLDLEQCDLGSDDGHTLGLVLNVRNDGPACYLGGTIRMHPNPHFTAGGVNGHRRQLMWQTAGKTVHFFEGESAYAVIATAQPAQQIVKVAYRDDAQKMDAASGTFQELAPFAVEVALLRDPGFPGPVRFSIDVRPTIQAGKFRFNATALGRLSTQRDTPN